MKRSSPMKPGKPLQRRSQLRATAPAKAEVKLLKMRKCPVKKGGCGAMFRPLREKQFACFADGCAQAVGNWLAADKAKTARKEEAKQDRAKLEAMKGVPELKKEAQAAFNTWVRLRDAEQPCISCNAPPPNLSGLHAGRDAGHYRGTGRADHMRFVEDNCHAQCVNCNQWGNGASVEYRIGLLARIGEARVAAVESDNRVIKWTRDGLRAIRDDYRARAAAIRKARR